MNRLKARIAWKCLCLIGRSEMQNNERACGRNDTVTRYYYLPAEQETELMHGDLN